MCDTRRRRARAEKLKNANAPYGKRSSGPRLANRTRDGAPFPVFLCFSNFFSLFRPLRKRRLAELPLSLMRPSRAANSSSGSSLTLRVTPGESLEALAVEESLMPWPPRTSLGLQDLLAKMVACWLVPRAFAPSARSSSILRTRSVVGVRLVPSDVPVSKPFLPILW